MNKKERVIGWIKDFIIVLSAFILLSSLILVLLLHRIAPISFFMIVFDLLFVIGLIISENLFNFSRSYKNDTYVFYIDITLVFLALIICVQNWDAVKQIW